MASPQPSPTERVPYPVVYDSNFWNPSMIAHVIFKELLCYKLVTPKERVSYPDISDRNLWFPGVISHVIFNELLCNKFVTPMEQFTS